MGRRRPQSAFVVGGGSIGRRHISNLQQLGISKLCVCDPNPDRLAYIWERYQAISVANMDEGLASNPDMVLICTPPACHAVQTLQAIRARVPVFVEKPVSHSMQNLQELLAEEQMSKIPIQVGYNLRFHPPIQKLKELVEKEAVGKILWGRIESGSYLPDWRPWQDYRDSYTASRELGGGIILDGSHELDYVSWLFGAPVDLTCMAGKVSKLQVDVEDCATVLLRFSNGLQLDVHVDFVERFYSRGCVLAGENGKLQWDFNSNKVHVQGCGEEPQEICFDCDVNQMYLRELLHFIECIERGTRPAVNLDDGIRTLRIALAARAASEERRWISFDE